jgi:predicted dehydrogenase
MRQVLQSLRNGSTEVAEVPSPGSRRGHLLIRTEYTLVSAGTERMLVEFGKAGWIQKALQQRDKVRMVWQKMRTDGIQPTIEAVLGKLDQPLPLGYCNVGTVLDVGAGVVGFKVGDRVASNGKHAEVVSVPVNLCARVPENVSADEACFTVLSAIALQGIRLVQPTLGEAVVVTGMGLIGIVTAQLLRAHGCRVLGIDFDPQKLALARQFGAETVDLSAGEDPVAAADRFSRGRGVDAVIVTAATSSNEPMHQAALMCRKRGRIVLVGVSGLNLVRDDFFKKELTFQVSCSYGPGRYDPNYEDKGQDYPIGFVRWTEQRNLEAVLDMMSDGRLDVKPLVSHRYPINEALAAYEVVSGSEPSLGILLSYPELPNGESALQRTIELRSASKVPSQGTNEGGAVSFLGAGNYATAVLIKAFRDAGAHLRTVASSAGVSGLHAARKFGFEQTTTDSATLFSDSRTDAVVITTRHDSHAAFVLEAIKAGKHVFVEKPLCLTLDEVDQLEAAMKASTRQIALMVGFNRRFSPHVQRIKSLLRAVSGPKSFVMTVNAGAIPSDHWTQDAEQGGGRIVGEGCHFIDLLRYLADSPIKCWHRSTMQSPTPDTTSFTLCFGDGSIGTVHYFANGCKLFPKERLEVFASGRVLQLDNFRKLRGFGWKGFSKMNLWRQDKGQLACAGAFLAAVRGQAEAPIPLREILEVSRVSIEISQAPS